MIHTTRATALLGVSVRLVIAALLTAWAPSSGADNFFEHLRHEAGNCFSGGCDVIWHLNQRFDQGLQSKSESLVGPAKQAFDDAMKELFDQRLTPLIGMVNAMAAGRIWQAQEAAQQVIVTAETGVDEILDHAAKVANSVTDNIKDKIIEAANEDAKKLVQQVHDQAVDIINQADCAVAGNVDKARLIVQSMFSLPHPLDPCFRAENFYVTTPRSDDYVAIYRIRQCQLEQELTDSWSVRQISDQYARLATWAQTMRCVVRQTGASLDLVDRDITRYTKEYQLWTEVAVE